MTETINGVRRELHQESRFNRTIRFYTGENERAYIYQSVQQKKFPKMVWRAPQFTGVSGSAYNSSDEIRLHAEALRQAADVFDEWNLEAEKEIES